jgi:hypothetical protein
MFDRENLHKEISNITANDTLYAGPVIYDNNLDKHNGEHIFHIKYKEIENLSLNTTIDQYIEKYHGRLYFQKSIDWRDEQEFRWVARGKTNEPLFVSIANSLQAIIVGQRFPEVYLAALYPLAEEHNILVIKCFWFNGEPSLFPDMKSTY